MRVEIGSGQVVVLVADMQALFAAPEGPFENTRSGPLVAAVNELTAASRDRGLPVVHCRYVLRADGADAGLLAAMPGLDLALFGADSEWTRVDDRVEVAGADLDCTHNRPSAFHGSDLDAVLRGLGADRLVLAGLSLNNAIAATARDAFARDLPVLIPRQAVDAAPFEPEEEIEAGFAALDRWTAEVADLGEVIERLPRNKTPN